jgi:predicted nucleotidyltransferase
MRPDVGATRFRKQEGEEGDKKLVPRMKAILSEIRSRFDSFYGPRLMNIMLYGSHSRGEAEPGSDIDILVVLRGPVDPGREIAGTGEMVSEMSLRFGEVISCVFVDEDQFLHRNGPLLRNVRREGIPL